MKLVYSIEDIERWRDKTYRRAPELQISTERQALAFINRVGFCLAVGADGVELPSLWDALARKHDVRRNATGNGLPKRNYFLSYAWEIQSILPNHNSIFYGKIFKRRPSLISREFFPYFYVLSERSGEGDEYKSDYTTGKLSPLAKRIMDILMKNCTMTSKELRFALMEKRATVSHGLERALDELQRKLYINRVVGNGGQFGTEWVPVVKSFRAEVRKARKIPPEKARTVLLQKYFQNQLITSVESIHKVFGWSRQSIYHAVGTLVQEGAITPVQTLDGIRGKLYCLVH